MSPETCSTRRLITKLAPTRIAIPTVCSVSTVGYAQMDGEPRNQSVNALFCRRWKNDIRLLLHVVLGPGDVVVQPLTVRANRIEERDALGPVLHRMSHQSDRIAGLVAGAGPPLSRHDVDRAAFDVPEADALRVDARPLPDIDCEVHVRVLPFPFSDNATILDGLVHLEHRKGMVREERHRRQRESDDHQTQTSDSHAN